MSSTISLFFDKISYTKIKKMNLVKKNAREVLESTTKVENLTPSI